MHLCGPLFECQSSSFLYTVHVCDTADSTGADEGFDSLIVPGRSTGRQDRPYNEEYVLFDPSRAIPLYLVEYTAHDASDR